jgi:dihydrofolate synthase/folylpolyglutamate synthase
MTYQETIHFLYNSTPVFEHVGASAYKEGLENTLVLDEHFGHPHHHYPTIHVAGTNGKGSCSHTIASILQEAGYKVGLYTSPHLVDFRERIRINGQCISKKYVVDFVENFIHWNNSPSPVNQHPLPNISKRLNDQTTKRPNDQTTNRLYPSFFELTTALAFKYFADEQVDVAVIEVGLGGRLDCTNIITPILSIITNISFDHTGLLGDTLAKIAAEKAGIIKKGVPVVIGEYTDETRPVFEEKAKAMNAPIIFAQDEEELGCDLDFELKGDYQARNKQTILTALKVLRESKTNLVPSLSHSLVPTTIRNGLANVCKNTGLMGRWQTIQERPKVICDTGHNVGGWQYLSKQIAAEPCRQLRIVFGMVDDKDIDAVMELLPKHAVFYWTQADNHRAIPAETVAQKAESHQLNGRIYNKVSDAYQAAIADASPDDFIFVGGSSYLVADFLSAV